MTEFGVGTYIRNVVRTLAQLDRESEFSLIGSPAKVAECGSLPPNFHTVPLAAADNTFKGNIEFRAIVRRLDCDVVHIPHLYWVPRGLACPYVLTVHDLLEHMYGSPELIEFAAQAAFLPDPACAARRGARDGGVAIHQERNPQSAGRARRSHRSGIQ